MDIGSSDGTKPKGRSRNKKLNIVMQRHVYVHVFTN